MAVNLADLDMAAVREHYLLRERTHRRLRQLYDAGNVAEYVRLALGITDAVYYGTKLRGASNAKAKSVLGFAPRRLEWL